MPLPPVCRGSYFNLLLSLTLLGLMYPLLEAGSWGPRLWQVCFWLVLVGATRAVYRHPRVRLSAGVLAGVAIALGATALIWSWQSGDDLRATQPWLLVLVNATSFVLLVFTTCVVLYDVLGGQHVDIDKMIGAVCVYVLLGIAFAELFLTVNGITAMFREIDPEFTSRPAVIYFSFTSLTTLGYGDIAPPAGWMRVLAPFEAIVGQLYLTILVARLVGLHISQRGDLVADPRDAGGRAADAAPDRAPTATSERGT